MKSCSQIALSLIACVLCTTALADSAFDEFDSSEQVELSMKCLDPAQGLIRTYEKIGNKIHIIAGSSDAGMIDISDFDDGNKRYILAINSMIGEVKILIDYKNLRVSQKTKIGDDVFKCH